MIVFDLKCTTGHVFEAWFGSTDDYEGQKTKGLVSCPMCGDTDIGKAVMAPAVAPKGNQRPEPRAVEGQVMPDAQPHAILPEQAKEMLAALAQLQAKVEESCDYVGDRFADEARAIHHGESEARGIYGVTSLEEAKALHEEGVPVAPLPFRPRRLTDA